MLVDMSSGKNESDVTKPTALLVEDNPHLQTTMAKQLRLMGFRVLSAKHHDAALSHLGACEPNIACIDVQLPCKSGYQVCEYIRATLGLLRLPILMTSDRGDPTEMAYAEEAGANAFLCKPFSMHDFTDCIHSLFHALAWSARSIHELKPLEWMVAMPKHAADQSGVFWSVSAA
jgi:DNA-binding response OmpR family regulator